MLIPADPEGVFMRREIIGALAVALLFSPAVAKNELANVKSVAIISAIGDCLNLPDVTQQGMGLFGKAMTPTCAVIDGFDEAVTQQLTDTLGARFAVRKLVYDRAPFAKMPFVTKMMEFTETDIDVPLKALKNPGVDAYIVVQKMRMPNVFADSDTAVDGIGIAHEGGTFSDDARMYAFFRIKVIDARTFKTLLSEPAKLPKTGWLPRWPTLDVEEDLYPGIYKPMNETQKAKAKPLMLGLLHDAVAQTLKNMELVE
jgi:hypothetical protein